MKNKKQILSIFMAGIILVAAGILGYYWYQGANYISTDDARFAASTVTVTPQITGRITDWNVTVGQNLQAGDNLGWQDTNSVASSSGVNPATLNHVGSMSISKAEIIAPITGQVIQSSAQKGQMVSPGQTLAIIANSHDMYVSANIEETKVNKVKVGQTVDVTIDALNGKKVQGKVEEIGRATLSTFAVIPTQNFSGSYTKVTQLVQVKINVPGITKLPVAPGMSVEVKIYVKG